MDKNTQKNMSKKQRDQLREVVRFYGINLVSQAEKLDHMSWLLKHYPLSELKSAKFFYFLNIDNPTVIYDYLNDLANNVFKDDLVNGIILNPADKTVQLEEFFDTEPYKEFLDRQDAFKSLVSSDDNLNLENYNYDHLWDWEKDLVFDSMNFNPVCFDLGSDELYRWHDRRNALIEKTYKIKTLVNYRFGQLLYKSAYVLSSFDENNNVVNVPPLYNAMMNINKQLVIDELTEIIEFIHQNKFGEGFNIKVKAGEIVYWLEDDKKNINPFKHF